MAGQLGGTQAGSRCWHEGCEIMRADQAAGSLAPVTHGCRPATSRLRASHHPQAGGNADSDHFSELDRRIIEENGIQL